MRSALAAGLIQGGFKRDRRSFVRENDELCWKVKIDSRPWAGIGVSASLTLCSRGRFTLLENAVVLYLEALPVGSSLEAKQALDATSTLDDQTRSERLRDLAIELAVMLEGLSSRKGLREAEAAGHLRTGYIHPLFRESVDVS